MIEEKVTLNNEIGLHARPASKFIRESIKYKSTIEVVKGEKIYNAKSIMGVLSMGAVKNDTIIIRANGDDEEEAVKNLVRLIQFELGD
ncbi:HPr family phosphocarrier protein [Microaceticoccus formicicus]|uniref:HPr family phosphocarrier protein n=1 Tax=Microaceticoccus formicicus TaxID=3118105 RepID=UPI003CCFF7E0|nr:HPr family phosphocarrier protein [Peptoniphilaceae bacterium AMB_02]